MALINYNGDNFTPGDFSEYTPPTPTRQPGKRGAGVVLVILGLIFLGGLAALFVYGPKYVSGLLNSGKQESAAVISAGQTATAMATGQFTQVVPSEGTLLSATVTPEVLTDTSKTFPTVNTNTPLPENTPTPSFRETEIVAALQTSIASQLPTESESVIQTMIAELAATPIPTATDFETTVEVTAVTESPELPETAEPTVTVQQAELEGTPATSTGTPEPTATLEPSPTATPSPEPTATLEPTPTATATIAVPAEAAESTPTATVTELPDTGFADDIGLPFLAISSLLLLTTIILSRKKRLS